ncbi:MULTISPECIES: PFL_4669 family integrating conjugative element protein [Entomomonas]|uniref:TIGR03761 family integrating conjugative element protein n=1 Tax=Entomomonas asaccharolytica TaxID=2785331 RepID=A0A974NHQ7_9GAMM|nr:MULTISPECIES: TIGR03761 family integrating conjugative element protein [Entomomonas]QQP86815.1 TIGR03761 family integrating conjugative element protein [Entomomonas asaccharolytica]UYZ83567.1 TIGR03761 family integrating conjugative element protein [Entomomonas sp. E2T0]
MDVTEDDVYIESENRIGPLQSQVVITLHTIQAMKLWEGRKATDPKKRNVIIGLPGFISRLNAIHFTASFDDPYADWDLIKIEDKYNSTRRELSRLINTIKQIKEKRLPKQIKVSENLNINPCELMLISKSPLGFSGAYMLVEYDDFTKGILQLRHLGLIGRTQSEDFINEGSSLMRSFYSVVRNYRNSGATRDDFAANNARARQALERMGELPPKEILEGRKRSEFAPVIKKRKLANIEPVIKDDKTEHSIPQLEANVQLDNDQLNEE